MRPIQNEEKLPATKPERMLSEAPPCCDEITTSRTCLLSVEVKALVNSGMTAPASVPNEMIVASTHHSPSRPGRSPSNAQLAKNVTTIDTADVTQTRLGGAVRG